MIYQLGLTGYPLAHSLSPCLHSAALRALGLAGAYRLYPVEPEQARLGLSALAGRLRRGELHGLNVTIPYKQTVLDQVDRLDPVATHLGAVNTLVMHGEYLLGANTDSAGFLADLQRLGFIPADPTRRIALVLGAGGSARAVLAGLLGAGWQVRLAARRLEQAEQLRTHFQPLLVSPASLSTYPFDHTGLALASPQVHLLINTTPLGMHPNHAISPWDSETPLPEACCVYDLVYNPSLTQLVRQARQQGLAAASGLGMLVHQAALAFQLWTGHNPLEIMWQEAPACLPNA